MTDPGLSPLPGGLRSLARSMRFAIKHDPLYLALACGTTLATVVPEVVLILVFRALTDNDRPTETQAVVACVLLAFTGVAQWLTRVVSERVQLRFGDRLTVQLEAHVARLQTDAPTLDHHERGEILDRLAVLRDQVFALSRLYSSLLSTAAAGIRVAVALVLLGSVAPVLALLGLFALPPVWVAGRLSERTRRIQEAVSESDRRARHCLLLTTDPGSAKELRVSGTSGRVVALHRSSRNEWYRAVTQARWLSAAAQACSWLIFGAAFAAGLMWVVTAPGFADGDVAVLLIVGSRIATYLRELVAEANFLRGDWLGVSQRLAWLEDYVAAFELGGTRAPDKLSSGVSLRDVTFTYPNAERPSLSRVDLELPAGKVVAVVGKNGAGKSTLVKLLARMYEPTSGAILVDGERLDSFAIPSWRRQLAATFQDFESFQLTLRDAVGLGDVEERSDEAIHRAIRQAGATDILERLPRGLDQRLGASWPDGEGLSFGQWQRVAVARGMVREKPLVRILDEPSAALDPEAEHLLFERYSEIAREARERGTVTVIVSHRFSTVQMADLIVVVDNATIVEQGDHDQLMRLGGQYARLYSVQAEGYAANPRSGQLSGAHDG